MTPAEPTRDDARAQLALLADLLDQAEAHCADLPADLRAQVAAMPEERAHEQFIAALAVLPPVTRIRVSTALREALARISPPEA